MSQQGDEDWWQKLYEDPEAGPEPDPGDTLDHRFRSASVLVTDPGPPAPTRIPPPPRPPDAAPPGAPLPSPRSARPPSAPAADAPSAPPQPPGTPDGSASATPATPDGSASPAPDRAASASPAPDRAASASPAPDRAASASPAPAGSAPGGSAPPPGAGEPLLPGPRRAPAGPPAPRPPAPPAAPPVVRDPRVAGATGYAQGDVTVPPALPDEPPAPAEPPAPPGAFAPPPTGPSRGLAGDPAPGRADGRTAGPASGLGTDGSAGPGSGSGPAQAPASGGGNELPTWQGSAPSAPPAPPAGPDVPQAPLPLRATAPSPATPPSAPAVPPAPPVGPPPPPPVAPVAPAAPAAPSAAAVPPAAPVAVPGPGAPEESRQGFGGRPVVSHLGDRAPTYAAEPGALPAADPAALDDLTPDTVLEGARYGAYTLRAASLRGDSARYRGEARRDCLLTARFGSGDDALVLVVLAGGDRAAPGAREAAADLCHTVAAAVGRSRERLADDIRAGRREALRSGLQRLTDRGYGRLRARAAELGLPEEACTAGLRGLLLPLDPQCAHRVCFGAGPGGVFRLRAGRWQDLEPGAAPGPGTGALTPAVAPAAPSGTDPASGSGSLTGGFRFRASVARPGDTLLLCTGGLAEPMREEALLPAELAARWSQGEPPGLAAFLADTQLRLKGYADDRTAAAVWEA
ncbi:protein phosphatase 2C domain-containing protein [Streptomyces sp. NPDC006512]|uniref:protein phosphatase 2C domain-containing protein n=1 Tax=Streptomyces sp. NPDC006512 TaxID=3154307 RepID=UPI0033B96533